MLHTNPTHHPRSPCLQGTTAAWYTLATGGRFGILPSDPAHPLLENFSAAAKQLEVGRVCRAAAE